MEKKKVLHILDSLCVGGMEKIVIEICNSLDREHYDVSLLVLSSDNLTQLKRLKPDVNVIVLPLNNKDVMRTYYMFTIIPQLIRCIKQINPDIVHTHLYPYRLTAVQAALKFTSYKIKHYHTIHTSGIHYENKSFRQKLKLKIEKIGYHLLHSNIVAVSDEIFKKSKSYFKGSYCSLECIYNGVDLDVFCRANYKTDAKSTFNIVYVSRLHEGKNHITLFKAVGLLVKKYPEIKLLVIGDGNMYNILRDFIVEHHLENTILLMGNRDDVPNLLATSDIGVFPSEFEGFSLALLEMMAMQLPMICSDIPAFREVFKSEPDILYSPVDDYLQLSQFIERFYLDKGIRDKYALRSRVIAENFSIEKMVDKYEFFYHS